MVSANLLVHVLAALALFAFGWWALSIHKKSLFLRQVMRWGQREGDAVGKRILVMVREDFLNHFCNAIGASYTSVKTEKSSSPMKIRPQLISRMHLQATIISIETDTRKLRIVCENMPSELEESAFLKSLAASLGFDSCEVNSK